MRTILSCFIFLCSLVAWSQPANLVWGEFAKPAKTNYPQGIISADASSFVAVEEVRDKVNSINLVKYSNSGLAEVWRNKIDIPVISDCPLTLNRVIPTVNGFLMVCVGYASSDKQYRAYATLINAEGQPQGQAALVHFLSVPDNSIAPSFDLVASPDGHRLLFVFNPPAQRRTDDAISIKMLSPDLELMWEKELKLPYESDIIQIQNYIAANDGKVYLLSGKNPEKTASGWAKVQGSRYVVFYFSQKENHLKEYDVSLKDKRVTSVKYQLNEAGDLVIAGYYSNDDTFAIAGTFLFVLASDASSIKAAAYMGFTDDFLLKFKRKAQVDKDRALADFYLDHLILAKNGNILLVGEQYYATPAPDGKGGNAMHFNDVIVTQLGADGRILWSVKVPKSQFSNSPSPYMSYNCYYDNTNVFLYFNDTPENIGKLVVDPQGDATEWNAVGVSGTTSVKITPEGKILRSTLVAGDVAGGLLKPSMGHELLWGKRILAYEEGRSFRFCLIQ